MWLPQCSYGKVLFFKVLLTVPFEDKVCRGSILSFKGLFIKEGPPTIIQSDNGGKFIGEVV